MTAAAPTPPQLVPVLTCATCRPWRDLVELGIHGPRRAQIEAHIRELYALGAVALLPGDAARYGGTVVEAHFGFAIDPVANACVVVSMHWMPRWAVRLEQALSSRGGAAGQAPALLLQLAADPVARQLAEAGSIDALARFAGALAGEVAT